MSIDNKELQELLNLAQEHKPLEDRLYDYGKTSIDNYVRMNKFKHSVKTEFLNRVPASLLLLDYIAWIKKEYPEILPETAPKFYREIKDYFNSYVFQKTTYFLIRVPKRLREYEHPFNDKYREYIRMLWKTRKRYYVAIKKDARQYKGYRQPLKNTDEESWDE